MHMSVHLSITRIPPSNTRDESFAICYENFERYFQIYQALDNWLEALSTY